MKILIFMVATWYGGNFHGNITKSGEVFNKNKYTCASNIHKLGTKLKVTNIENNKSVIVKVNDTGKLKANSIDLSEGAFKKIAELDKGVIKIKVQKVK
jgi:rare lipoprotein A